MLRVRLIGREIDKARHGSSRPLNGELVSQAEKDAVCSTPEFRCLVEARTSCAISERGEELKKWVIAVPSLVLVMERESVHAAQVNT